MLAASIVLATWIAGIQMPPKRYDHKPVIPTRVHIVSDAQFDNACFAFGNQVMRGCAYPWSHTPGGKPFSCSIYLRKTSTKRERALVLRHEHAHCNGWPSDHPA